MSDWISADTPPKMARDDIFSALVSDQVLAITEHGIMHLATYEQVVIDGFDKDEFPPHWYSDGEHWVLDNVTHWMPLPPPPRKEQP